MNKRFYWMVTITLAGLGLLLASCSKQPAAVEDGATTVGGAGGQFSMPLSTQLALGILKLEGTDAAVTAEQAAELLPLWKAARTLSAADNVTTQELDAVYAQIEEAMTDEQMSAIQEMELSAGNMAELAKELGIEMPAGRFGNLTPEMQSTMEAARASGQPPAGFVPGAGPGGGGGFEAGGPGGFEGGGFAPPGAQGSTGTQTPRQGGRGGAGTVFFQAVIDLLEKKIQ